MARLTIPATTDASPEKSRPLLAAVERQLGMVPNLYRLIGTSPAVLEGHLGLSAGIARTLDVKTRERIALAVAQVNGCDYCLSAHTYLGLNLSKIDTAEIALNRRGHSSDARADAAVQFAVRVAEARGRVSSADLATVRLAGFTDAQIVEIVQNVAVNLFTNYLNNVAETDIDFPAVSASQAA